MGWIGRWARGLGLGWAVGGLVWAHGAEASDGDPAPATKGITPLIQAARELDLARHPEWLRLGHYRPRLAGGYRSEADGPDFFLAPTGHVDPAAELEATLVALEADAGADANRHARCRFPARRAWLADRLAIPPGTWPDFPCPDFDGWFDAVKAPSISLVFASAFLNNPASMYGHTFLRLEKGGNPLLDYTLNFAAVTDTRNIFLYSIKGVFGGFPGYFSTEPYYLRVRKYNDVESRDLWTYHLRFASAQVNRLLQHAWELGTTHFDYYYFNENCSYQLLPLLEVADPSLDLSARFRRRTLPIDTVRAIVETPDLVTAIERRPSPLTMLIPRRSLLARDEIRLAERFAGPSPGIGCDALSGLPASRKAAILDTAYDLHQFLAGPEPEWQQEDLERERLILSCRREIAESPLPAPEVALHTPLPHSGHRTLLLGLGGGLAPDFPFAEVSIRPAVHDLLADPTGYPSHTRLEMGHVVVRLEPEPPGVYLETFDVVHIVSLSPLDRWIRKPSWKVRFGTQVARDLGCRSWPCTVFSVGGGIGGAVSVPAPYRSPAVFFLIPQGEVRLGPVLDDGYALGAGAEAGLSWVPARSWRTLGAVRAMAFAPAERPWLIEWRVEEAFGWTPDVEIRAGLTSTGQYREGRLGLRAYF